MELKGGGKVPSGTDPTCQQQRHVSCFRFFRRYRGLASASALAPPQFRHGRNVGRAARIDLESCRTTFLGHRLAQRVQADPSLVEWQDRPQRAAPMHDDMQVRVVRIHVPGGDVVLPPDAEGCGCSRLECAEGPVCRDFGGTQSPVRIDRRGLAVANWQREHEVARGDWRRPGSGMERISLPRLDQRHRIARADLQTGLVDYPVGRARFEAADVLDHGSDPGHVAHRLEMLDDDRRS